MCAVMSYWFVLAAHISGLVNVEQYHIVEEAFRKMHHFVAFLKFKEATALVSQGLFESAYGSLMCHKLVASAAFDTMLTKRGHTGWTVIKLKTKWVWC